MEQNNMFEPIASTAREEWEELLHSRSFWGTIALAASCFFFSMLRLLLFGDRPFDLFTIMSTYGAVISLVNYLKKKQKEDLWNAIISLIGSLLFFVLFLLNRLDI